MMDCMDIDEKEELIDLIEKLIDGKILRLRTELLDKLDMDLYKLEKKIRYKEI